MDTTGGGESRTHWETGLDISLPCGKQRAGGKLLSLTQGAQLVLCDDLERWHGAWEGGSRGRGYVYRCIHTVIQQNRTQHCKAIIL